MNSVNSLIYYDLLTGVIIRAVSSADTLRSEYFDEEIPSGQGRIFVVDAGDLSTKKIADGKVVSDPTIAATAKTAICVGLLSEVDWMTWRHRDQNEAGLPQSLTTEQYNELLAYRQALRDWPVNGDYNEPYPTKPEFIK